MPLTLSEVPGDRAVDVLAACLEAVTRISQDKRLVETIREADGGSQAERMAAVAAVLRDHKADVYAILAAIAGTTVDGYLSSHNAGEVLADAFSVMTDEAMTDFLHAAPAATGSRGDASASTGDRRG